MSLFGILSEVLGTAIGGPALGAALGEVESLIEQAVEKNSQAHIGEASQAFHDLSTSLSDKHTASESGANSVVNQNYNNAIA